MLQLTHPQAIRTFAAISRFLPRTSNGLHLINDNADECGRRTCQTTNLFEEIADHLSALAKILRKHGVGVDLHKNSLGKACGESDAELLSECKTQGALSRPGRSMQQNKSVPVESAEVQTGMLHDSEHSSEIAEKS